MNTATEVKIPTPVEVKRIGVFAPCDGPDCSARSYYFAEVNGTELSYCGHHANKYEVGLLRASKGKVIDLRHTIGG